MTRLCPRCFGEKGLKKRIEEIRPLYPNKKCTYHPKYKGIPIDKIVEIIDQVFRENYVLGQYSYDIDMQEGNPLDLILYELAEIDNDDIAKEVTDQLISSDDYWPPDGGEPFYDESENYVPYRQRDYHHSELWEKFCRELICEQRFFNSNAKSLISEIFDGIQSQQNSKKEYIIYKITPDDAKASFFRARLANGEKTQKEICENPSKKLGPPPERKRRAGRMNPSGISAFYGAYDMDTCIAELRPVVGSEIAVGQFKLVRPMHVLDTTRFSVPVKPMSLFGKQYIRRIQQWNFMQRFMDEISKPIFPDDEHLDYIPTQAVAEYLLHHHEFKRDRMDAKIEAIIYRSAQWPEGKNIVFLGDAAMVEPPLSREDESKENENYSAAFKNDFFVLPHMREREKNQGLL